ncbi:hypothetical protein [Marinoscillum luteum]|uniref:Uncharacterized protein n=1 Tax=Marinoscillum luteum TaxID=861051 RepID=A0ABW7N823_9BACT
MKALRCFLSVGLVCSIALSLFAQVADKLSYQAVIRNASGNVVSEKTVSFRVTILQGSATGASVYTQSQKPVTNVSGLITIEIGGDVSFSQIDWGAGPYFIKTEVDLNGGTNYSISGVSQLLSVPVALYAKTAETLRGGLTEADPVFAEWDKSEGISISGSQVTDLQDYLTEYSESDPDFNASPAASVTSNDLVNLGNLSGTNTGDQDLSGLATTALVESVSADVAQLQSELNALSIDGSETSLIAGDQISISGEGTTESPYAISLDQKELAFQRISGISQFIFSGSPNVWRQVTDLLITIDLDDGADVFVSYNVSAFAPSYYSTPYFATRLLVDEVDQVGMRVITSPSNASHCNNSISSIISLSAGTHTIRVEYRTNFVGDPLNNWPGNNDYQSRLLTVRELR